MNLARPLKAGIERSIFRFVASATIEPSLTRRRFFDWCVIPALKGRAKFILPLRGEGWSKVNGE